MTTPEFNDATTEARTILINAVEGRIKTLIAELVNGVFWRDVAVEIVAEHGMDAADQSNWLTPVLEAIEAAWNTD
jgi:hypothetical protein